MSAELHAKARDT